METSTERNIAALTHLSTLTQYFIPFGNYIFPIVFWTSKKDQSEFVNHNGKQALNFQLSILIYSLVLAVIAIPIFLYTVLKNISFNDIIHNVDEDVIFQNFNYADSIGILTIAVLALLIIAIIKIAEFFLVIYASVKASNGEEYNYPFTIPFLK
ncbi:DUF4870 domain-containing protein [Flavobacterium gilvum]|uniref:DUF4870 domain-containing protein n=1 Tax=Flavobacterium gilvum TaxID=1492737 RepID=A0AAC9N3V0_9FLAO|nr:DUF4870 domain-containing protein [Flavobacterium gilvum]AOW09535.1 hypothetical protein EM308_08485 [Flavobacterium gilvum]KFC57785.1 hypothetical protein FEM08_34430 [Flavobacterium gilvum]